MKKQATILASVLFLLGTLYLTPQIAMADDPGDTTCWNVYKGTLIGGYKIWRCTPSGCVEKRAKEWSVQGTCPVQPN